MTEDPMTGNTPSVRDSGADGAYRVHALLESQTLRTLEDANEAFLLLLAQQLGREPGPLTLGLPGAVLPRIAALAPAARALAARCPYALFNLQFGNGGFWSEAARSAPAPVPAGGSEALAFAHTAVFMAWHLAQGDELAAALVLGMTPAVRAAWRALPLSAVTPAAAAAWPALRARWAEHRLFWPALIAAATARDALAMDQVHRLGLQLLAADGLREQLAPARGRAAQPARAAPARD
jgi:hypothetical protein